MKSNLFIHIGLLLVVAAGLVGCEQEPTHKHQRLLGTWVLDVERSLALDGLSDDQRQVLQQLGQLELQYDFQEDNTLVMTTQAFGEAKTKRLYWRVLEESENQWSVAATRSAEEPVNPHDIVSVRFQSDGVAEFHSSKGDKTEQWSMVLVRPATPN